MKRELDEQLCAKYPKIFVDRHGDMRKTAMVWGFPGDGWYDILDELCGKLQDLTDNHGHPQVMAMQVKEKFGGLRFYVGPASKEQHDLIDEAESKSYETCEVCGKPGHERGGRWIKTLCDEHANEQQRN